jgi:RHH-type proline utilization regulon transcriptional repressor/proline dehydrogenase/delta 1-pyrroline-5-carboxylate dehydrogenase
MLKGAMAELEVGDTRKLSVDVGPVITAEARDAIVAHIETMSRRGHKVTQTPLGDAAERGTFVAPTLIEIDKVAHVEREVFGPVLHVLRFRREALDALVDDINAAGYGLTFGLHTRIDETIARVTERIEVGNIYVNRNIIGATVGVQPFGGARLSGTGPKAGGPLYLSRLAAEPAQGALDGVEGAAAAHWAAVRVFIDWLRASGHPAEAERCVGLMARSPLGARVELRGPVGERNIYALRPRGRIAAIATSQSAGLIQIGAILATGNDAVVNAGETLALKELPPELMHRVAMAFYPLEAPSLAGVLFEGEAEALVAALRQLALRPGPIVRLQALTPARLDAGEDYDLAQLVEEVAIATNTAAAGGNASLMTIG